MKITNIKSTSLVLVLLFALSACDRGAGTGSLTGDKNRGQSRFIAQSQRKKMPEFNLPALQDNKEVRSDTLPNKVVLAVFFTPWCGSCYAEMTMMQKLWRANKLPELSVVGLAISDSENIGEVESFIVKLGLDFPVVLSNEVVRKSFGGVSTVPTAYLANGEGNIVRKYVVRLDRKTVITDINMLLQKI